MNYAFAIAAVLTVLWWVGRRLAFYWRRRVFFQAEGIHPDKPIFVTSYRQPKRLVQKTKCYCGGVVWNVGEGPTEAPNGRRVSGECEKCHRIHRFHFDMSNVPN
ncbi:MAG: hypothetical protein GY822_31405 [Deltaproteobacteria bacterium]|nr:hypothetical protein [Deltaproteobacteria bacterium]